MKRLWLLPILVHLLLGVVQANPGDTTIERKKYFTTKANSAITFTPLAGVLHLQIYAL